MGSKLYEVNYDVYGTVLVEASSQAEANKLFKDSPFDYVDEKDFAENLEINK